ncbi:MAG: SIMPL domain-containing protein, partial [Bacteroidetes bacterium]|nr:SIMPL domain-containing protein [Bacteroidota bacterium]
NPVSYTDFDIVVNPEILEPVVQFTYSVNIKYIIKEKKEIPKNTYMILTPDGKIQQIQIN